MTTGLPYREALSLKEAIESIQTEAGTQFDPEMVEAFVDGQQDEPAATPPEDE